MIEALTATVVVVSPRERIDEAVEALAELNKDTGLHTIFIAEGAAGTAPARSAANATFLDGVPPRFLNNAVAALRLSSLPSVVWWRGGSEDALPGLAVLADRLILDAPDPSNVWKLVPQLTKQTAVTDLRWTRLTRWRAVTAQFFEIDEVREASAQFRALDVAAADPFAARLFAGWIATSLPHGDTLKATLADVRDGGAPLESIRLTGDGLELKICLAPSRACVESSLRIASGARAVSRMVAFEPDRLPALIAEELRIRSRDVAFERAVRAAGGKP